MTFFLHLIENAESFRRCGRSLKVQFVVSAAPFAFSKVSKCYVEQPTRLRLK